MATFIILGLVLAFAGCACIYFSSPHQRWFASSWPSRSARIAGSFFLIMSQTAFLQSLQAVPAAFTFIVCLMLLFVFFPYFGALISVKRSH